MVENWQTVGRPGYLGKKRDETYAKWDREYGKGNWRLVWLVDGAVLNFLDVCLLYEFAYLVFLNNHPEIVEQLTSEAREIYDDEESNVASGMDYTKQETTRTHIQDIAIRRCLSYLGVWFRGKQLIRIRQEKGNHPLSITLSPGNVPFNHPEWIAKPELVGWWKRGSVEAFYQSNRFLQVKI